VRHATSRHATVRATPVLLCKHGIVQSTFRFGACLDNAAAPHAIANDAADVVAVRVLALVSGRRPVIG